MPAKKKTVEPVETKEEIEEVINVVKPVERKDLKTSAERIAFDAQMFPEKNRYHKQ